MAKYTHDNCTNPFAVEGYDWPGHYRRCEELQCLGFVRAPDWIPVGMPGYQWEFPGAIQAFMRPAPRLRHRLIYTGPIGRVNSWLWMRAWRKKMFSAKGGR